MDDAQAGALGQVTQLRGEDHVRDAASPVDQRDVAGFTGQFIEQGAQRGDPHTRRDQGDLRAGADL
ncbi:MAG: hypothetical protein ACRC35_14140 [Angustibacter sp.]